MRRSNYNHACKMARLMGVAIQRFICAGLIVTCAAIAADAQDRATLIADLVEISDENRLIARGNVEVLYNGARLLASEVLYDRAANKLQITGPMRLDDGTTTTILAAQSDLSDDLRNGLILGAQVILDGQLQLTAAALQRVDGRYNTLQNSAASSCNICEGGAPLWEIRAKRVVQDTAEKQLYFDDAVFRFGGVPLAYFPRLRLADPSLQRATGFLVPRAEANSTLGFGLKFPYFINISPHKDLTLTPFLTTMGTRSLDLRYRQAYRTGNLAVSGAVSQDNVLAGKLRGYVVATGAFDLPRRYKLSLRGETVSDAGYFRSYGLNEQDRFVTSAQINRADRRTYVQARVLGFYSVRASDSNATQPSQIADFERGQRVDLANFGDVQLTLYGAVRQRASTNPFDGADSDTSADGRDVGGYGLRADWRKDFVLPMGILATGAASWRGDAYRVQEDALFAGQYRRSTGGFSGQLRWPLIKTNAKGALHTIEPLAQIVLVPAEVPRLFNEDSALVEFDEGNLFAINRFAGSDRVETGNRANFGIRYSYAGPKGMQGQFALGRVVTTSSAAQFAKASGLGQRRSDWLVAGQLDMNPHFGFALRGLVTEAGDLRKLELRGTANRSENGLSLAYLFAPADVDEQRSADISEITLNAVQRLSPQWKARVSSRYDAIAGKTATAGGGLVFRNECLQLDLSLSRSFPYSTTLKPNTVFGLSVAILGFGGQTGGSAAQCHG